MITKVFAPFKGRHYKQFTRKAQPLVARINALETEYQSLSDEALRAKTAEFRGRHDAAIAAAQQPFEGQLDSERAQEAVESARETVLEALLPEAFAAVKNAARRLCGQTILVCEHELKWEMVHYDVQLIGGLALHRGNIAEMATGEGKTLVATLPLYLNALTGRNCQLVTVNDYLARRDAEWMGYLYKSLGLTVGCIQNSMPSTERQAAYGCDITYGTSSEFGFDYLRDNGMAANKESQVQRDHYFCIVDEIDSILVDEARTPLIISGPAQQQRDAPFVELKPSVKDLVANQVRLCNQLVNEAKEDFSSEDTEKQELALTKLLQVRLGMPKNRQLMKLLQEGPGRRLLENFQTEMQADFNKRRLFELKEQLFYVIDERQHSADLTEMGRTTLSPNDPDAWVLPDLPMEFMEIERQEALSPEDKQAQKKAAEERFANLSEKIHCISQLLRAYSLYERDVEYVVQEGKVHIIDQNTGRMMPGRRWSDGLHQAVEAKEGVAIEKETKTYATVTVQNYFRLYQKLAGMTGTAETEAGEFNDIYGLNVMVIPTHKPCIRADFNDVIYKTRREKYKAVIDDIKEAHGKGQPILVGTASVDSSETLSRMLKRENIRHAVLNAKYHQQEAEIVSQAGRKGAVTIATNMAGRGTDIKLGEGVHELGGLLVLGTERHESRRIDRQLRGRCARQGDPGASRFFVSLEDDLMRLFASAGPIAKILDRTFNEGDILEHPLLNRSIESAQKKVEQRDFSIRKRLLQFDDVLNRQREVIYGIRNQALHDARPRDVLFEMVTEELETRLEPLFTTQGEVEGPEVESFLNWANAQFPISLKDTDLKDCGSMEAARDSVMERIREAYKSKEEFETPEDLAKVERYVILRAIDSTWQDHLTEMDSLRQSVSLRSYGQRDPLQEYKSEAFKYFEEMLGRVRADMCTGLFRSASNVDALKNMIARLTSQAKTLGPANQPTGGIAAGAAPAAGGGTMTVGQMPAQPAGRAAAAGQPKREVKLPKVTVRREVPKLGRNEMVTIRKGDRTETMKFKKAQPLLENEGWQLEK
ncbi:MAG: preprotein translocase subunit SecA [Opitutales bacterium]